MYTPIDQQIAQWFNSLWGGNGWGNLLLILCSILFAALAAFLIGYEREYHGHSAGLRTHLLVAIGSATIMVISIYGFSFFLPGSTTELVNRDPARLAAQVISGIGFLGAGTIIQTGIDVKGLTTATTLWLVMAIGLAAGSGSFVIASIATIIAFVALVSLRKVEKLANRKNPYLIIIVPSDSGVLKNILETGYRFGINIRETTSQLIEYNNSSALRITIRCHVKNNTSLTSFVGEIRENINPLEIKISSNPY